MATKAPKKEKKPKKEKPLTPARVAEGRSNLTDDSLRDLLAEANLLDADIKLAASELRERSGRFRAHMKLCKKNGLTPTNVRWWLDTKIREIEDVNTEIVERNRIARVMEFPIGRQLGLFDDGVTVATAIDEDKIKLGESGGAGETDTLAVAYHLGHEAGMAGKTYAECKYTEGTPHYAEWLKAWDDAQFELGSRIQPTDRIQPETAENEMGEGLDETGDVLDKDPSEGERDEVDADMPF